MVFRAWSVLHFPTLVTCWKSISAASLPTTYSGKASTCRAEDPKVAALTPLYSLFWPYASPVLPCLPVPVPVPIIPFNYHWHFLSLVHLLLVFSPFSLVAPCFWATLASMSFSILYSSLGVCLLHALVGCSFLRKVSWFGSGAQGVSSDPADFTVIFVSSVPCSSSQGKWGVAIEYWVPVLILNTCLTLPALACQERTEATGQREHQRGRRRKWAQEVVTVDNFLQIDDIVWGAGMWVLLEAWGEGCFISCDGDMQLPSVLKERSHTEHVQCLCVLVCRLEKQRWRAKACHWFPGQEIWPGPVDNPRFTFPEN